MYLYQNQFHVFILIQKLFINYYKYNYFFILQKIVFFLLFNM